MSKTKIKILIVEDEELLIQAIQSKLGRVGIDSTATKLGQEAIDMLLNMPKEDFPDVIWLDYYLPDMSGIDFMHKLKENEKLQDLKVVVVSNSANDENVGVITALGVKKYIIKAEHTLDQIIEVIKELVSSS